MITKLDLYKVFCQVGKSKSFSKAAKELFMTQPAVSQSIMQLEKELDIRLFNRNSKGVSLTNEGNDFKLVSTGSSDLSKEFVEIKFKPTDFKNSILSFLVF